MNTLPATSGGPDADRFVEELKAAMAGRGLGTPATRAQIIENLLGEQYLHREGRDLIVSPRTTSWSG